VKPDVLRAALVAMAMVGASLVAIAMTPRHFMSDQYPREKLSDLVPRAFGDWQVDSSIIPVPPSPDLQQVLDETYDETLALTYQNRQGQRVMLSLAYGRNQHKGMNTHRPEICYPAQGFKVLQASMPGTISYAGRQIDVTRLVAAAGARNEPITYWLLVGEQITHFGYSQRKVAMRYGLQGVIPDGVLVRVSSIDADNAAAFRLQERFIRTLLTAVPPDQLPRLLGRLNRL
jgi:EpsI family protein